MGDLTRHFSRWEFIDPLTDDNQISIELVDRLQAARTIYGKPITISSGVRLPSYNYQVGGKSDSAHLKGLAADIACDNSTERFLLIDALLRAGFKRIGFDAEHIHVDVDESKPQGVIFLE